MFGYGFLVLLMVAGHTHHELVTSDVKRVFLKYIQQEPTKEKAKMISAKEARKALIELSRTSRDILIKREVDTLRKESENMTSPTTIEIGRWSINLSKSTFGIVFTSNSGQFFAYAGKFEIREDGNWQAIITYFSRGRLPIISP